MKTRTAPRACTPEEIAVSFAEHGIRLVDRAEHFDYAWHGYGYTTPLALAIQRYTEDCDSAPAVGWVNSNYYGLAS